MYNRPVELRVRIVLSSSSGVPMYEQIKTQIRSAVHGGHLVEGMLLPSLRNLAAELRVSVITVTRAYNDLVAEHLVVNEHGRGFVVSAVDQEAAQAALRAAEEEAVVRVVEAAMSARTPLEHLHAGIDEEWRKRADSRD